MTERLLVLALCTFVSRGIHAAPTQALPTVHLFEPGVISGPANDGSPTFSPDGNMLLFTRSAAHWSIILESRRIGGSWSEPKIASFSGQWPDSSPAMSPDGSFIVFVSTHRDANAHAASHLWRVDRTAAGWGDPTELPESVNFCASIFRPSVASDGSVYFTAQGKGKNLSLFRSRYESGAYRDAEALSFSDGSLKDVDPEIAPDQSFLIFTSLGRGVSDGSHEKLFITHNHAGVWDKPMPIRYADDDANGSSDDNDARLGNDHRTLYFSSDRSVPVHFPRTKVQARKDFERMQSWDNGNTNVWFMSLS